MLNDNKNNITLTFKVDKMTAEQLKTEAIYKGKSLSTYCRDKIINKKDNKNNRNEDFLLDKINELSNAVSNIYELLEQMQRQIIIDSKLKYKIEWHYSKQEPFNIDVLLQESINETNNELDFAESENIKEDDEDEDKSLPESIPIKDFGSIGSDWAR